MLPHNHQSPNCAGPSELPDTFKALFRTVSLVAFDPSTIAEVVLLSCGFIKVCCWGLLCRAVLC